jgi:hypothetical protein
MICTACKEHIFGPGEVEELTIGSLDIGHEVTCDLCDRAVKQAERHYINKSQIRTHIDQVKEQKDGKEEAGQD